MLGSQPIVRQIPEGILEAVVPEEEDLILWNLADPLEHDVHYILKRSGEDLANWVTYFLPRANRSGLMSTDLNAANQSSQGATSYECGPVNIIGMLKSSNIFRVEVEQWYGALSKRMMVFLLQ